MASTIMCHFCEGAEAAELIVTVQANGETVGVGVDCLPMWGLVIAGVEPSLIDEVLAEAYRRHAEAQPETSEVGAPVPAEDEGTPTGADDPPAPRPRRARKATGEKEHRDRVRKELAERPDTAATSEAVIPQPGEAGAATVAPGELAVQARDEWIARQGGEEAIKRRMTDPLIGHEDEGES